MDFEEFEDNYNLYVGLRIREIRESMHLTRSHFGARCDISESFLAAIESGKKGITSKTLYKICTNCNVSADYILFGHGQGFETDTVLEIINQLDESSRKSAIAILTEFGNAINNLQTPTSKKADTH